MIPKTHTQALALLAEEIGAALTAYGHRLHGLDPETENHAEHLAAMDLWKQEPPVESVKRETVEPETNVHRVTAAKQVRDEWRAKTGRQRISADGYREIMLALEEFTTGELKEVLGTTLGATRQVALRLAEQQDDKPKRKSRYDKQRAPVYRFSEAKYLALTDQQTNKGGGAGERKLLSRSVVRNHLMSRPKGQFTVKEIAEELPGYSPDGVKAHIRQMKEIIEVGKRLAPGAGRAASVYEFRPGVGQPQPEKAEPEKPRLRRTMHVLRQNGARKPQVKTAMRDIVDLAWDQGWMVTVTGSGHLQFIPPDESAKISGPMTPSDVRGIKNLRAQLKRSGLEM